MSEYRKIHMPKCPYCKDEYKQTLGDYQFGKLVGMVIGNTSDDVVIKCKRCNKKYRVTVSITYHSRHTEQ